MTTSLGKSFDISKQQVWDAFRQVRRNRGAPGVDEVSLAEFEEDLGNNLYKIWNRLCSGSYFPPPVKAVEIPKPGGGVRVLGVPTVSDRIAQTVVANHLASRVEPIFHVDSYGYRPNRSALQAVEVTRRRCWEQQWVVDLDIRAFFDTVDHELLMKAVAAHTDQAWVLLYVRRWLTAPLQTVDGTLQRRDRGTPQGSAVSPVLANLFLHYAFDAWMTREHPGVRFARYVDDIVVHAATEGHAKILLRDISGRMEQVGLQLHPDKTQIVYCQDARPWRRQRFPVRSFTFLGYTFAPRPVQMPDGREFIGFNPAVSQKALKAMGTTIRRWRLHRKTGASLEELAAWLNPIIRGWTNYYGRFTRSVFTRILVRINTYLMRWARRKFKLRGYRALARWWRHTVAEQPDLFVQWVTCRSHLVTR
jgi:RNA-directed DNA polymerase